MRNALENGSVAFYVDMEIFRGGRYIVRGRVYDSFDKPIAFLDFGDTIEVGRHEIGLLALGKVLVDAGAVPPLKFKDDEGWRMLRDSYPIARSCTCSLGPT